MTKHHFEKNTREPHQKKLTYNFKTFYKNLNIEYW